jgi:purine-binding chemotaxis protein CheW
VRSDSSTSSDGGEFDWPGVRAAVDSLGRILEAEGPELQGEEARAVLEQRAVALAAVDSEETAERLLEIVAFIVAGERYGIESRYVHEVLRRPDVARLPGATLPVFGLAARRGEILTLLDLRHLLALPPATQGEEPGFLVALGERDAVCGVLVDSIEGLLSVDDAEFHDTRGSDGERSLIRRIAPDALTLIDAAALLHSPY